jgi:hypothetical protein
MTSGNAFLRFCSVVDKDYAHLPVDQEIGLMSCLSYIQGFSEGGHNAMVVRAECGEARCTQTPVFVPEDIVDNVILALRV